MRKTFSLLFLIGAIGIAPSPGFAQTYEQVQKLVTSDGDSSNSFFSTVSVSGNYAVIGGISSAYVFEKTSSGWTEIQKLNAVSVPGSSLTYGSRVSIDGDQIFVEESTELPGDNTNVGAVHVYEKTDTGWTEVQVILPPDNDSFGRFGWSLDVQGNQAIIGGVSAVYFYEKKTSGWELVKEIPSPAATEADEFATTVSLSGNYAIVGDPDNKRGAAFIYENTSAGWVQAQKLMASSDTVSFGTSVSIDGDYAVVGGYNYFSKGAAYIFHKTASGWVEVDKLEASEGAAQDGFAYFVHISGDEVAVSDNFNNVAYLYEKSAAGWMEIDRLTPDDHASSFGESVFLADQEVFVSTRLDEETVPDAGVAYVFAKSEGSVAVTGFSLVDATTNQVLQSIEEGDKIDLSQYEHQDFNILVQTEPETVGSVALTLHAYSGPDAEKLLMERIENKMPYNFFGDKKGNARNWQPETNYYTLMATPFTERRKHGLSGKSLAVNFWIVQSGASSTVPMTDFSDFNGSKYVNPEIYLVNAENNQPLQQIQSGDIINLNSYTNKNFNIVVAAANKNIGSVIMDMQLDGLVQIHRIENDFPYATFGDSHLGFRHWEPETGKYTLLATAYSGKFGEGSELLSEEVSFSVVDEPAVLTFGMKQNARLTLYPNPGSTYVHAKVETKMINTTSSLSIFDRFGQLVYQKTMTGGGNEKIDISRLKSGLYTVQLIAGKESVSQRLIITP